MRMPCELRLMVYAYLFDAGEADISIDTNKDHPNSGTSVSGYKKHHRATSRTISIRNGKDNPFECAQCGQHREHPSNPYTAAQKPNQTRTRYQMIDRSFARRCVETTYYMVNKEAYICAALMRVNRVVHDETAQLLYATHTFDFGCDVEAVKPFLSDLSPATRRLVTRIALYKKGPWMYDCWSDRCEWRSSMSPLS